MKKVVIKSAILAVALAGVWIAEVELISEVYAHPGRTASDGCHYCRTNCSRWGVPSSQRHCHGGGGSSNRNNSNGGSDYSKPKRNEDFYNSLFCNSVGGRTEVRHGYIFPSGQSYVIVDCETATHVYECGLDKRSSLDSVQQALFFAHLTGKNPAVVIYDTDGKVGRFEHRIKTACRKAGVKFISR